MSNDYVTNINIMSHKQGSVKPELTSEASIKADAEKNKTEKLAKRNFIFFLIKSAVCLTIGTALIVFMVTSWIPENGTPIEVIGDIIHEEFTETVSIVGDEFENAFGEDSDFQENTQRVISEQFGEDSNLQQEIREGLGEGSEFAQQVGELGENWEEHWGD